METLMLELSTRGLHRYHAIDQEVTTIGRAFDNDIILSDATVEPHHLKIIRYGDDSTEFVNLAEINPTRIDRSSFNALVTSELPIQIEIGRVQARLLARRHPVDETRALAGNGNARHLFGHIGWVFLIASFCLLWGGLEFYSNSYTVFKWSEVWQHVMRETVLTLGGFVLALAVVERLLVNRWELKQLIISVCGVYLLYQLCTALAEYLSYVASASWPTTLFYFAWHLALIPAAIALYLIHISHLKQRRSILLALLISSPISFPSILQSAQLQAMLQDFSLSADYQKSLSSTQWHFDKTLSIDTFIERTQALDPGEFVN